MGVGKERPSERTVHAAEGLWAFKAEGPGLEAWQVTFSLRAPVSSAEKERRVIIIRYICKGKFLA